MKNRTFLIFGILIILAVTIVCLWSIFTIKETIGLVCHKDTYSLTSYNSSYNLNENQIFISNEEEIKQLDGVISHEEINDLDINNHDYLIYFLTPQYGCERIQRLNCVEYTNESINLNFSTYKVDTTCNIIFLDSFVIELPKKQYNSNIKVNIVNT